MRTSRDVWLTSGLQDTQELHVQADKEQISGGLMHSMGVWVSLMVI
jgi:hypothetical protein